MFLKVFTEFVTVLLLFYVLVLWPSGMRDLYSQPGIEPASPELEGEDLTIGTPGKSQLLVIIIINIYTM